MKCKHSFQSSREQSAIAEFANSLLVIPRQLAVNAALESTDLVAKLRAYHNSSQTKPEHKELKWFAYFLLVNSFCTRNLLNKITLGLDWIWLREKLGTTERPECLSQLSPRSRASSLPLKLLSQS